MTATTPSGPFVRTPLSWYLSTSSRTTRRRAGWIIAALRDQPDHAIAASNATAALKRRLTNAGVLADELDGARLKLALDAACAAELVDRDINGRRTTAIRLTDDGAAVDLEGLAWPPATDAAPTATDGGADQTDTTTETMTTDELDELVSAGSNRQAALHAAATIYTGTGGLSGRAVLRLADQLETWLDQEPTDRTAR